MNIKRRVRTTAYNLYIDGVSLENIAIELNLSENDLDEIIDYFNEIYT